MQSFVRRLQLCLCVSSLVFILVSSKASSCGAASTLLKCLDVLFNLLKWGAALALEKLELLNDLSQHPLLEQVVYQLLVVFRGIEPGKNLHWVDDIAFFLSLLAFLLLSALEIQKPTLQHELFTTNALINSRIIKLYHIVLQFDILLCVILKVFKVSEQRVGISIKLLIEITSLGHITNNLSKVRDSRLRIIVVISASLWILVSAHPTTTWSPLGLVFLVQATARCLYDRITIANTLYDSTATKLSFLRCPLAISFTLIIMKFVIILSSLLLINHLRVKLRVRLLRMSPCWGLVTIKDYEIVWGWQRVFSWLVVKSVVMILAFLWVFGLHILIWHVFPVP